MALRNNYLIDQVQSGDEIEVWWPADKQYYPGVIDQVLSNGMYHITYLDSEVEVLRLSSERWRFRGKAAERVSRAHSVGARKRPRNFFATHEPQPIVIDDDDDEPAPKRGRYKQHTHHSNDAVIALDGTLSLSTQQSDVEIEEVPVQRPTRSAADHRASDVSDPIVSDIEHEVIEEEVLDRGYGGDTSSAADTSELQHRHAREKHSAPQNSATRNASKTTFATSKSTPDISANSHKDHRNSLSAQSASLSAPINYPLPNGAPSAAGNNSEPILSPAPLAADQLSPAPHKSLRHVPHSIPLKLPASALNRPLVFRSRSTAKATSALPTNPNMRNISSRTTSDKPALPTQEHSVLKTSSGITTTISAKPTPREGVVQAAISNPVPRRKKTGKSSASSPRMRAPKAVAQSSSKETIIGSNKKDKTADDRSERMAGARTDMTKSDSVTATENKTKLTHKLPSTPSGPKEQTTLEPPAISLAPAVNVVKPSDVHPSPPHGTSLQEKTKVQGATAKKDQHIEVGKSNKSSIIPVSLPTPNSTNIDASTSAAVQKQSSHPLRSSGSVKDVQHASRNKNGGTGKEAERTTRRFPLEVEADVCVTRTENNPPPAGVMPQKILEKQFKTPTQDKIVATSAQAEAPPTHPTNVVPRRSLTKQLLQRTQSKSVMTPKQVNAPPAGPAHAVSQKSQAKQSISSKQRKMVATPAQAKTPSSHPAHVVPQKVQAKHSVSSSQCKMITTSTQVKAPSSRSTYVVTGKSQTKQLMSSSQSKTVVTPTQAKAQSIQGTVLVGDCRQAPPGPGAGPQSSSPTGESDCHERPKAKTSHRVSPNMKSRLSQPKSVLSKGIKSANIRQLKSDTQPGAMPALNADSTPRQIADASANVVRAGSSVTSKQLQMASAVMRKKARHPSPKVVSNERIPRNKALSATYASRCLRMNQSGNQSRIYEHVGSSRPLSNAPDQRIGPKTPMKPIPHISSPTPPRVHLGNASRTHDTLSPQSLGKRTTVATQEADVHLSSSISDADDRKAQAQVPRSPMPKSSGSISIQSLVSSPKDVTKPHIASANIQDNPQVFLFQNHARSAHSLYIASKTTTAPSSASKPYATGMSRLRPAPSVPNLPTPVSTAPTLKGSKVQEMKSIPQTLSSLQAATSPKTSNGVDMGKNQASAAATGNHPLINTLSSKKLPSLRTPRHAEVDKRSAAQNGRKRTAPEHDRLTGVTKRRRNPSGTQRPAGLRDVIENSKPRDSIRASSEAATVGNGLSKLDQTTRDGSVSLRGATLQRTHGANENSALVPGAATFLLPESRPQTSAPLNSAVTRTPASSQLQISTAPKVLDHFGIIGYQGASGAPSVKPGVNVSGGLPYPTASRNPLHPRRATNIRPRVVPSQRTASVESATRISTAPEKMCDSEHLKPLMSLALKAVDDKFSTLNKKTKQEFEGLKKSIETVSKDISDLGSRIDKVDRACNSCFDNFLKVIEKSLDRKVTEMNRQIQTEARETLLVERRRFVSSSEEITENITKVTFALFHTAIQDMKTALEEKHGRIQSGVTQSRPNFNLLGNTNAATTESGDNVRETTTSSTGNEPIRGIAGNRSSDSSERQPERSVTLGIPVYQHMSKSPSHCSTPQLRQGSANESNSKGISHQRLGHQSIETKSNELIARCVIDWLQNGGCRKKAPRSEREIPVTQAWVNSTTLKCFDNVIGRLQSWSSVSEAETAIAESLAGKVVETEWLIRFTDDAIVERARAIYNGWEPDLFDFEWQTEKKVMLEVAVRVNAAQRKINAGKMQYLDVLSRTFCCVVSAQSAR